MVNEMVNVLKFIMDFLVEINMKNNFLWFGFICLTIVEMANAQTYPTIRSAKVLAQVTYDTTQKMYFYKYSVFSDTANTGNIIAFEIDISRHPHSVDFDTTGLIFEDAFVRSSFQRRYPLVKGRIVPVGFPHSPGYWFGGFSNYLTANFSGDSRQLVHPGELLSYFTMMSKGLPAIRYCIFEPRFDVVALFPNPEEDTTITSVLVDSIREAVKYHGYTIGPTALDSVFNGLNFLDTIKSYINQSRSLGWITTQVAADKYAKLIDSARAKLVANKIALTRAKLDTVLLYANQDSSVTITSEAYALLRFNTEYLLSQLPQTFTLSLTSNGNGSITKDPDQSSYDSASTVQLTAVPATGYLFTRWSGNIQPSDSFSNPLSVTMSSNKTVTANFVLSTYTIIATEGAHVTISPSGSVVVNYGSNQTFTMTAGSGFQISDVLVDSVSVGIVSSYTFTNVTANHTITVYIVSSCSCCEMPGELDQLTLTDAKGKQKILFLRNAELPYAEGVSDSSVVAVTKKGTLNAKFKSGQLVQTVAPKLPIQDVFINVQSAVYPLKLSWNVKSKNKTSYWYIDSKGKKTALTGTGNLNINNAAGGTIHIQASAESPC